MIIRLGRLTPGYFRLLQLQVSGELASEPKDRLVNHLAFILALMGLGLSYYSVRQMVQNQAFPSVMHIQGTESVNQAKSMKIRRNS